MTNYIDDAALPQPALWDGLRPVPDLAMQDISLPPSQSLPGLPTNEDDANLWPVRSHDPTPSTYQQPVLELQDSSVAGRSLALQQMTQPFEGPSASNGILDQIGEPSAANLTLECGPGEDAWGRHRPTIMDLYEKNQLRKVIEIMTRKYGFRARHVPKIHQCRKLTN